MKQSMSDLEAFCNFDFEQIEKNCPTFSRYSNCNINSPRALFQMITRSLFSQLKVTHPIYF